MQLIKILRKSSYVYKCVYRMPSRMYFVNSDQSHSSSVSELNQLIFFKIFNQITKNYLDDVSKEFRVFPHFCRIQAALKINSHFSNKNDYSLLCKSLNDHSFNAEHNFRATHFYQYVQKNQFNEYFEKILKAYKDYIRIYSTSENHTKSFECFLDPVDEKFYTDPLAKKNLLIFCFNFLRAIEVLRFQKKYDFLKKKLLKIFGNHSSIIFLIWLKFFDFSKEELKILQQKMYETHKIKFDQYIVEMFNVLSKDEKILRIYQLLDRNVLKDIIDYQYSDVIAFIKQSMVMSEVLSLKALTFFNLEFKKEALDNLELSWNFYLSKSNKEFSKDLMLFRVSCDIIEMLANSNDIESLTRIESIFVNLDKLYYNALPWYILAFALKKSNNNNVNNAINTLEESFLHFKIKRFSKSYPFLDNDSSLYAEKILVKSNKKYLTHIRSKYNLFSIVNVSSRNFNTLKQRKIHIIDYSPQESLEISLFRCLELNDLSNSILLLEENFKESFMFSESIINLLVKVALSYGNNEDILRLKQSVSSNKTVRDKITFSIYKQNISFLRNEIEPEDYLCELCAICLDIIKDRENTGDKTMQVIINSTQSLMDWHVEKNQNMKFANRIIQKIVRIGEEAAKISQDWTLLCMIWESIFLCSDETIQNEAIELIMENPDLLVHLNWKHIAHKTCQQSYIKKLKTLLQIMDYFEVEKTSKAIIMDKLVALYCSKEDFNNAHKLLLLCENEDILIGDGTLKKFRQLRLKLTLEYSPIKTMKDLLGLEKDKNK